LGESQKAVMSFIESERWRRMLEAAGHFVMFVDTAYAVEEERSHA
jgi:hypothetical protein